MDTTVCRPARRRMSHDGARAGLAMMLAWLCTGGCGAPAADGDTTSNAPARSAFPYPSDPPLVDSIAVRDHVERERGRVVILHF
ncbi:MAG: hypothetical protein V3T70_01120, partial [Phycisphaerae bacterium]